MKSYGFFPNLYGLIKQDPLKQRQWDIATLQTNTAKISVTSLDPHDSAPYQQEVVWKERRPNSQILFINVCFHLNVLGYKWV